MRTPATGGYIHESRLTIAKTRDYSIDIGKAVHQLLILPAVLPSHHLGIASALGPAPHNSLGHGSLNLGNAGLGGLGGLTPGMNPSLGTLNTLTTLSQLNHLSLPTVASLGLNMPTTGGLLSPSAQAQAILSADLHRLSASSNPQSLTQMIIQQEALNQQNQQQLLATLGVGTGASRSDWVGSGALHNEFVPRELRSSLNQSSTGVSSEALISQLLRRTHQANSSPLSGHDPKEDQSSAEKRPGRRPFE